MIQVCSYRDGDVKELDASEISDVIEDPERMLWVDVCGPTDEDLNCLQEEFALHPLAIEDVRHRQQRPKLELYGDHAFIVAYTSQLHEVDFFWGPNWLVSVRDDGDPGSVWTPESARTRFERVRPERPTSSFLLYVLLDEVVDGYFTATDKSEDQLEELEELIFGEQLPDERNIQEELFDVRRQLLLFRRAVAPLREVVAAILRKDVKWVDVDTLTHMQDVYDHVLRATDQVDSQRELLNNAVDAHLAIISNRMNSVMKKTSSWGAILVAATLVAGIYGMNFENMPELGWKMGYAWALGLMLGITTLLWWYFRRKDWL
ncbi:MAG: magnesium/cobalt transporter CorA [Actinomycetota bacterium]|nr:magnesium/cobalt transporter CorA [Actinomycetota bacterium]